MDCLKESNRMDAKKLIDEHKDAKICLAASAGGHLSQLLKLQDTWQGKAAVFVTSKEMVTDMLIKYGRVYSVGHCDRQHPFLVLIVLFRCLKVIIRERPRVVISTGAAQGCIMCLLGKITGARIIWIDSITNIQKISLSGRIIRHFADLFIVQWKHHSLRYNNVEYHGILI